MKKLLGFFIISIPIIVILVVVLTSNIVGYTIDIPVESIELTTKAGVVNVNTSAKLEYEIYPKQAHNKQVIFQSSDESVATVDQDGNINFVGFGKVYITVTTVNGGKSQSCEYNIQSDQAYGINLLCDKDELILNDDKFNTALLNATIFPSSTINKDIIYSTSDASVAEVSKNGVIIAKGLGTVIITASTTDGHIKQTIELPIYNNAKDMTLSINGNSKDQYISESEFVDIDLNFEPFDTSEKFQKTNFESSDRDIATVNQNGRVIFKKPGKITVTATTIQNYQDSVDIIYTGGLPNSFDISTPLKNEIIYNSNDLSKNVGFIEIEYPINSNKNYASFKSSNTNVINVDQNGIYTIVGGGDATIDVTVKTAAFENGELVQKDVTKQIDFSIIRYPESINIDNISTNEKEIDLSPIVYPNDSTYKKITYKSLDDISSIDETGHIIFNKAGESTIELTIETDKDPLTKIIKVSSSFGYPTSCVIEVDKLISLNTPTHIVINSDATTDGYFTVDDELILTIENNVIIPHKSGKTTVTYIYDEWDDTSKQVIVKTIGFDVEIYTPVDSFDLFTTLYKHSNNVYYTATPSFDITYKIMPDDAKYDLKFASNDISIAKVSKTGHVYFNKPGRAIISAICTDANNNDFIKDMTIEYTNNSPISINLANNIEDMWPNESIELNFKDIIPYDCINPIYTINDSNNLLNVNGNQITANKPGNTTLNIMFSNGYKITKDIKIKQPINEILIKDNPTLTSKINIPLSFEILPKNADNKKLTIETSNPDIAIINSGVLTFKKAGLVTINVIANDLQGAKATCSIESTYGKIKKVTISNKIVQKTAAKINIEPSDFNGEYSLSLVSELTNDASPNNVVKINNIDKSIIGAWPGNAIIKLTSEEYDQDFNIEVLKVDGDITDFQVDDIVIIKNNNSSIIPKNFTTSFKTEDKDIEKIYIEHLIYSYTYDDTALNINNNVVKGLKVGIYPVKIKASTVEKTFNVYVFEDINSIHFSNLKDEKINISSYLTKGLDGEIISTNNTIDLGTLEYNIDGSNSSLSFMLKTDDSNLATIENNILTFKKPGHIKLYAKQKVELLSDKLISKEYIENEELISINYTNTLNSYNTYINGVIATDETIVLDYENSNINIEHKNLYPKVISYTPTYQIINELPNDKDLHVLSVNDNVVSIVSGGKATLRVTILDKSYDYNIEVIRTVTSIQLGENISTYLKNVDVKPQILPQDATNHSVSYYVAPSDIATVDTNGRVTFIKPGTVTVTVTACDTGIISSTIKITSTLGGISDFNITKTNVNINKGDSFSILENYIEVIPQGVSIPSTFTYEISSNIANNNATADVIELNGPVVTGLCGGNVIISVNIINAFGESLSKTLDITVHESVNNIIIDDVPIIDKDTYGNYVTALNNVTLNANVSPITADDISIEWLVSDPSVATISNGKLSFIKEGTITVTVKSINNPSCFKDIHIRYTNNKAISVSLESNPNSIMNAGETFSFNVSSILPSNITSYNYNIKVNQNNVNNNIDGNVLIVDNNTITANLGGTCNFTLYVNGYEVGTFDITVKHPIESIILEENNVVIESLFAENKNYKIKATFEPADSNEHLIYSVQSGNNVTVDQSGNLSFKGFSQAVIRVTASDSKIYKDFNITYKEKVINKISITEFSLPKGALIGGENYYVEVKAHYENSIENLDNALLTFENKTPSLYTIDDNGKITANNVYGTAGLIVKFKTHTASINFTIAPNITNLSFALRNVDNNVGIKNERVFGTYSFNSTNPTVFPVTATQLSNEATHDYQMNFTSESNSYGAPLVWDSSDKNVATIDQNGKITRISKGITTITCKPKYQPNDYNTCSYTFKFVDGIDVTHINQYEVYSKYLTTFTKKTSANDHLPVVLHTDIIYNKSYKPNCDPDSKVNNGYRAFRAMSSLYGNGHTIDGSEGEKSDYKAPRMFQIAENDVFIDNVKIIGRKFRRQNSMDLSSFENEPRTITIRTLGYPQEITTGVVIANSTIMNGSAIIEAFSARFKLTGCELMNSFYSNIILNCFGGNPKGSHVDVTNCIFRNALLGGIELKVDKENLPPESQNIINLHGNIYVDNWRNKREIPGNIITNQAVGILKEVYATLQKDYPEAFVDGKINMFIIKLDVSKSPLGVYRNPGVVNNDVIPYIGPISTDKSTLGILEAHLDLYVTLKNNETRLPGLSGPLSPNTPITSEVYQYIRDTSV